ncbi:hypothetical protein HDU83_005342 [Entophlyctis luteolus]|nr:hypothetical protein HDU83_005342 [Entophlyctis luteolus]KAJ3386993.1 hypothetical protein HDU84_001086 [Entophlyctis sp. JEL0112]
MLPGAESPQMALSQSLASPRPPRSSSSPNNLTVSDLARSETVAAVSKPSSVSARIDDLLLSLQDFATEDYTRGNSFDSDLSHPFDRDLWHPPVPVQSAPFSPLSRSKRHAPPYGSSYHTSMNVITLENLQTSASTLSGFLDKLNPTSTFASPIYKRRFFVFTPDANLYLFKTNTSPTSMPITFLPVTKCEGFFDARESAWCLQVHGSGIVINEGGSGVDTASMTTTTTVQRSWCLKFADEHTMNMWMRQINRVTLGGSVQFRQSGSMINAPPLVPVQIRSDTPRHSNDTSARGLAELPVTSGSQYLYQQQQLQAIQHFQQQMQHQAFLDPLHRSQSIASSYSGVSSVVSMPLPAGLLSQRVADYSQFNGDIHAATLRTNSYAFRSAGMGADGNYDASLIAGDSDNLSFLSGATDLQENAAIQSQFTDDPREKHALRLEIERRRAEVEMAKQRTKEIEFANINKSSVDMVKKVAEAKATADKLKASLGL